MDCQNERSKSKLKLAMVTPFLPYPNAPHAGGVLVYESLKRLSYIYDVYLLSRLEPHELQFVGDIEQYCKEVHLYTFKTPTNRNPLPIILSYIILGMKANRLIKRRTFDLVQVEFTETGFAFRMSKIPSVLVAHDVITKPALRRYEASKGLFGKTVNLLKLKVTRCVERYVAGKFDMVFTMSTMDRNFLLSLGDTLKVEVSPNLIGLNFSNEVAAEREPRSLLFVGAMKRWPNVDAVIYFYENVLPLVRRDLPDVKFYVVGGSPPDVLLKMAEEDPSLILTGFVKDVREYFFRATVFVSPMLVGGGIIVKNLHAMSCGLPVVTTSIGNEGIEAVSEKDVFVADTPADFAYRVLQLLNDEELRKEIGERGKMFVQGRFSDDYLIEKRGTFYQSLLRIRQ